LTIIWPFDIINPVELLGGFMSVNEIVSELTTGDLSFRQICQIYNISMAELQEILDFMIDMESDPFEPCADDYIADNDYFDEVY